jgi:hypothetical protein
MTDSHSAQQQRVSRRKVQLGKLGAMTELVRLKAIGPELKEIEKNLRALQKHRDRVAKEKLELTQLNDAALLIQKMYVGFKVRRSMWQMARAKLIPVHWVRDPSNLTQPLSVKMAFHSMRGIKVEAVAPHSPLAGKLLPGDMIKVINSIEVFQLSPAEVKLLLASGHDIPEVVLRVKRGADVDTVEDRIALRAMIRQRNAR